jgi:hypothetical protein
MGWLYMKSLKGHAGPSHYLDDQLTYDQDGVRSRVLKSALVAQRVFYAAVEQTRPGREREVFAVVCLVDYNPHASDGYIFGYKDMTETMGPHESDCPEPILDLLMPTDNDYARAWRERCRANAARRVA